MKALKIIGGILAVLLVIWLIMCAMGPARFDAGASAEMDAPASIIYETISDLNTWQNWGPWMAEDPNMTILMGEKTQGAGASYAWQSEKLGDGSLEIVEANPNASMKTLLKFDGMGDSNGQWMIDEKDGKSTVTWSMKSASDLPFFARGFMLLGGDQSEFFAKGLNNIKEIVEKKAKETPKTYGGYTVNVVEMPAKAFVAKRDKISMADIQKFFSTHFPTIYGKVAGGGGKIQGMPHGIYYQWDEVTGMTDLAAAIPVAAKMDLEGYETIEVPAGKTLLIDYYGPYEGGAAPHAAMEEYLKANGLEAAMVLEEYVTDPTSEPDTSKWLTKIYYTLK